MGTPPGRGRAARLDQGGPGRRQGVQPERAQVQGFQHGVGRPRGTRDRRRGPGRPAEDEPHHRHRRKEHVRDNRAVRHLCSGAGRGPEKGNEPAYRGRGMRHVTARKLHFHARFLRRAERHRNIHQDRGQALQLARPRATRGRGDARRPRGGGPGQFQDLPLHLSELRGIRERRVHGGRQRDRVHALQELHRARHRDIRAAPDQEAQRPRQPRRPVQRRRAHVPVHDRRELARRARLPGDGLERDHRQHQRRPGGPQPRPAHARDGLVGVRARRTATALVPDRRDNGHIVWNLRVVRQRCQPVENSG